MTLNSYIIFFIWFLGSVVLSFLIDRIWSRIISGKKYRFFVAPGVIVHELSHAIACVFTGARIGKISFFSRSGGFVEHGRSKFGFFGAAVIAMAPLFGITLFLWALIFWFGYSLEFQTVPFTKDIIENFRLLFHSAWSLVTSGASGWRFWLFLYLIISLVVALAPSKKDFQNAFWGLLVLFLAGLAIFYFQGTNEILSNLIGKFLGRVVTLGVIWELIALLVGLPIYILKKFFIKRP